MDCNNYSYSNTNSTSGILAEHRTETGNIVYISEECNYFGERYFSVCDIFDEIEAKEFEYIIDDELYSYKAAREQAARYYNSFVPDDNDAIPMF